MEWTVNSGGSPGDSLALQLNLRINAKLLMLKLACSKLCGGLTLSTGLIMDTADQERCNYCEL